MSLKPLNLDDLLGQAQPIVVLWQGNRYLLRRPEGLSPVEYTRWAKLQAHIVSLKLDGLEVDKLEEQAAAELEKVVSDAIRLLSADLADAGLSFGAQMLVLQHYVEAVKPDKAAAGSGENQGNPTGA